MRQQSKLALDASPFNIVIKKVYSQEDVEEKGVLFRELMKYSPNKRLNDKLNKIHEALIQKHGENYVNQSPRKLRLKEIKPKMIRMRHTPLKRISMPTAIKQE